MTHHTPFSPATHSLPRQGSPSELPVNPYKYARMENGYSQDKLAAVAGVSRHYITRVEQGLYAQPSPKLATALGHTHEYLLSQYSVWQKLARLANNPAVADGVHKFLVGMPLGVLHPHVYLRRGISPSQIAFCITLKVQPSRVDNYEKSKELILPPFLKEAYVDAGVTLGDITAIESRFRGSARR